MKRKTEKEQERREERGRGQRSSAIKYCTICPQRYVISQDEATRTGFKYCLPPVVAPPLDVVLASLLPVAQDDDVR